MDGLITKKELYPEDSPFYEIVYEYKYELDFPEIPWSLSVHNVKCKITELTNGTQRTFSINVKWDGCMNLNFDTGLHFCDKNGIETFHQMLNLVYKRSAQIMSREEEFE